MPFQTTRSPGSASVPADSPVAVTQAASNAPSPVLAYVSPSTGPAGTVPVVKSTVPRYCSALAVASIAPVAALNSSPTPRLTAISPATNSSPRSVSRSALMVTTPVPDAGNASMPSAAIKRVTPAVPPPPPPPPEAASNQLVPL